MACWGCLTNNTETERIALTSNSLTPYHTTLTVKTLKIGTSEIITIIVLHLERLDFTVQYCVQKMQTEYQTE